jgi:hypothetical protein
MPIRVQRYGGPQVGTAPLLGVRVSTQAPAGAFLPAQPIDPTGAMRAVADLMQRQQQQADEIALNEIDNHLAVLGNQVRLAGEQRKGRDALAATPEAEDAWTKGVSEIEQQYAKNGRQRQLLQMRAGGRWAQLRGALEQHAARELRQYDTDQYKAALATRVNDATSNYGDPAAVGVALLEAQKLVRDFGQRNGWSQDVREDEERNVVSAIHTGVLNRMLSAGNDRAASAYYEKAKGEIRGDDAARIEKALQVSSTLAASQREVDGILATTGITREQAFQKARGITDPEVRRETEQLLDVEFARRDRAERDTAEQRFKQAFDYANRGRRPPAPLWAALSPSEQVSIDQRIKQLAGGEDGTTDWGLYYKLRQGAASNPQEFAKVNLLEARSRLAEAEWKELVRIQTEIKSGSEGVRGFISEEDIVREAVTKLYPDAKKGNDDEARANEFRRELDAELRRWKEANPSKKMPIDEFRTLVESRMVRSVFVPREPSRLYFAIPGSFRPQAITIPGLGSRERALGEVPEDERGRAYVPHETIPPASRDEIENAIRESSGRIRSRRQVERAYAAWLMGDRQLYNSIIREGIEAEAQP